MAIGWLTVLKLVPWAEVVKNAPAVADGAKRLWDTASRKPRTEAGGQGELAQDAAPAALLQARLAGAEASIAELHQQMQASSALIKALAEQNTELIRRVETNRVRLSWLVACLSIVGAVAAVGLVVMLAR